MIQTVDEIHQELLSREERRAPAAEQLAVMDDDANGILSALNRDGLAPFDIAAVHSAEDLDDVEASLQRLATKGDLSARAVPTGCLAGRPL